QVVAFAQHNHLKITGRHQNRLVLDVNGSVADVQHAFNLTLRRFKHPTESRDFYAPDVEPTVVVDLPVVDVIGLNDYILPHPLSVRMESAAGAAVPRSGSGPGGTYRGNDLRTAYLPGVNLTGAGQTLGLVQFDGFYATDIAAYELAAGLPQVPLQTILLDGYDGVPTTGPNSGNGEVSLDIEMAVSMAPGLAKIVLFEAGATGFQNDILSAMASHSEIKQLSCSWGWGGGPKTTTDNLFKQMAAQGQSFFSASGDSDAFPAGTVDDPSAANSPSDCPYITVVGGTTLNTSSGAWGSEAVWNRGGGVGSSGGISSHYAIPAWQSAVNLTAAGGSSSYRNTPDVACVAENIFVQYGNGSNGAFGGTSCAAPLWAGLAAVINQQAVALGKPTIGFINPAIYALATGPNYSAVFHDVTSGDNTWSGSANAFHAVTGYDLCTGWGTPAGAGLITALAGPADELNIVPASGLTLAGAQGGPFTVNSSQIELTNSSSATLNWSLLSAPAWLSLTPASGTLPPNAGAALQVQIPEAVAELAEGSYSGTLLFSNQVSHRSQSLAVSLRVGQSLLQNGGFETGDFSDWTLAGRGILNNASTGSTVYNAVEANGNGYNVAHSGSYGAFLGDTQVATLSQSLATVPGQSYLVSLWLNNPTKGTGQRFAVNWNATATISNTLFSVNAPGVMPWTNLQFLVTATQSTTTLQLAAENDNSGFGVDDVSVKPLPSLGFQSIQRSGSNCTLSWRAAAGVHYQVQSTTDLAHGPWFNLGSSSLGTGQSLSVTDPDAGDAAPHKFYRVVVSP